MKQKTAGKNGASIQSQIMKGYLGLIAIVVAIALLSVFGLRVLEKEYDEITRFQNQQITTQQVIAAHYKWLEQLSEAITTQGNFQGSLDPATCALGSWINTSAADVERYPEIKSALGEISVPHEEIHLQATELINLAKRDRDAAFRQYQAEFQPKVEIIGQGLGEISGAYQTLTEAATARVRVIALASNVFSAVIGVLAAVIALLSGRRTSRRIADPILAVAEWSEQLSSGVDNRKFDVHSLEDQHNTAEVSRMIRAFQEMAQSIRDNVRIIQKVAEGDLTAYVDIKSAGDSLGRNLYHLVQNNDQMFAGLLRVADSVATNAEHIASASQALAESSTEQASAVEILSGTVDRANSLAAQNAEKATQTAGVIQDMQQLVQEGKGRMDALTQAVEEIRQASEKISLVMKSINDIAFQTNILALNAAVEAARAGTAGKGFAVVADEVRNLSMKSAEAADQSRELIEDTISRVHVGSEIAEEASEVFRVVAERAPGVSGMMDEISAASDSQQELMDEIHGEIARISSVVQQNAASSEETAAATQQMTANAEVIRREMRRFSLRRREEGKPYIPPEKADDEEFIRIATENYQKAKRSSARPGGQSLLEEVSL